MKDDLEEKINDGIDINSELLYSLDEHSRLRYRKILFLGICESVLWISFILMTIFSIISSELDFFLEGLLFAVPAIAIDFFVLKNYRNTKEYYQLRNDLLLLPARIKHKLQSKFK